MKRILLSIAAAAALFTCRAQMVSTEQAGWLARGTFMEADRNPTGALQQLERYKGQNDAEAQRLAAQALLQLGRTQEAEQAAKHWLLAYPSSSHRLEMQVFYGDCALQQHLWATALRRYQQADGSLLGGDQVGLYHYHKAFCLMMLGEYIAASQSFGRALETCPRNYRDAARFYQGYCAFCSHDYEKAQSILVGLSTDLAPCNARDYYLAQMAFAEGDWAKTIELAQAVPAGVLTPELLAENHRVLGEALYHEGETAKATEYLSQYVEETSAPLKSALYILGISQYTDGRYEQAISTLAPVATDVVDAMSQSANLYIGQALLRLTDYDTAMLYLNKALKAPFDSSVAETAMYNYAVASTHGAKVPFGSTVATFEQFVAQYPESRFAPQVNEYIVTGYLTDRDYHRALASIQKAKKTTPALTQAKQRVLYSLAQQALAQIRQKA